MTEFNAIDYKTLQETIQHLKPSTYYLDTLPASFLKNVYSCLAIDLLKIVNSSLLSGIFPL